MTVKQLKAELKSLPDDMEVILRKDSGENGYSPLDSVNADCVYMPDTSYRGEVYQMDWSADDACIDKKEWKKIKAKPRALVLYPVN